jgi:cell division protease FtsH
MSHDDTPGRRSNDGKSASGGPPILWYFVAAIVGMVVVGWIVMAANQQSIEYSDFLRLVERSKHTPDGAGLAEGAPGYIEVEAVSSTKKTRRIIRFSNLREVMIGEKMITGGVDRQRLEQTFESSDEPVVKATEKDVRFTTNRLGNESENAKLIALITENNLKYAIEPPPGIFRQYFMAMLFMSLIIVVFVIMLRRLGGVGSPMSFGRSKGRLVRSRRFGRYVQRCRGN